MKKMNLQKWTVAGLFCAAAVVGSLFSFPVFSSKCAPVQHMVNVLCAVLLGPEYAVAVAFSASLLRNLLGLGTLMAFPGSMFGALLCGIAYRKTENLPLTFLGEVFGTSVIGGLAAYQFVWDLGDVGIGLMTVFNMIALLPLAPKALAALDDYEKNILPK